MCVCSLRSLRMHTRTHRLLHYLDIRLVGGFFCFFFFSEIQFIFWSCLSTLFRNILAKHSSNAGGISEAEGFSRPYCSLSDFSTGSVRRILAHKKTKFCFLSFETFKISIWTLDLPISIYSVPEVRTALVSHFSSEGNGEKWTSEHQRFLFGLCQKGAQSHSPLGITLEASRPQQKQEASTCFKGLV